MGEYGITHKRTKNNKIHQVQALMLTVQGAENPAIYNRESIIKSITDGNEWYTCKLTEKKYGKYGRQLVTPKQKIHLATLEKETFLRTDKQAKKADHLEDIPSF